jgi:hypothetical protein
MGNKNSHIGDISEHTWEYSSVRLPTQDTRPQTSIRHKMAVSNYRHASYNATQLILLQEIQE